MYEELLTDVGLTRSEIAVYLALLELGSSTTGHIIKKAGIASGKTYLVLDKLVLKGLVTYVTKGGRKYYNAKDPERLLDYLKEKENELKKKEEKLAKIIPILRSKYKATKSRPTAEIYEGVKGFKTLLELELRELKKGDCINIMGVPRIALEKFDSYLINWNKRRIRLGIKLRIIYNHDCGEFGKKRERMRLTEVRYMRKSLETPTWICIFKDFVVTKNVYGHPVCFLIRDSRSADSYRRYFELVWKQSEKSGN